MVRLPFVGDERALLNGMRARQPAAMAAFCDRYTAQVWRLLARMLGSDSELEDLHHEVFVRALRAAEHAKDVRSLSGWLTTLTVNVVRTELQRRARRRWLTPLALRDPPPDAVAPTARDEDIEALRRTYALLDRLAVDLRIPFALRIIEGMNLRETADACGVSLATVKRRLSQAEKRFTAMARKDPLLTRWLQEGGRWESP